MNHYVLLLALALVVPPMARADSWNTWQDQRVVSASGKYYVVMTRTGGPKVYGEWGPVEFIICQCGPDAPRVTPAKSKVVELGIEEYELEKGGQRYEIKPNPNVRVRDGDKIIGRGTLKRPPLHILVSDAGLGFTGLDVWGYNYAHYEAGLRSENAVVIVSSAGKVIHRRRLIDLFSDDELADFDTSSGGMWWLSRHIPGWINEEKKQLVLVAASSDAKPDHHLVRFIDWDNGQITSGPTLTSQNAVKIFKREHLERNK